MLCLVKVYDVGNELLAVRVVCVGDLRVHCFSLRLFAFGSSTFSFFVLFCCGSCCSSFLFFLPTLFLFFLLKSFLLFLVNLWLRLLFLALWLHNRSEFCDTS